MRCKLWIFLFILFIDTSMAEKAVWDKKNVKHFCDIYMREVNAGHRPLGHLNRVGWKNVAKVTFLTESHSWQLFQPNSFQLSHSCQLTAAFPQLISEIRFSGIHSWTKHTLCLVISLPLDIMCSSIDLRVNAHILRYWDVILWKCYHWDLSYLIYIHSWLFWYLIILYIHVTLLEMMMRYKETISIFRQKLGMSQTNGNCDKIILWKERCHTRIIPPPTFATLRPLWSLSPPFAEASRRIWHDLVACRSPNFLMHFSWLVSFYYAFVFFLHLSVTRISAASTILITLYTDRK